MKKNAGHLTLLLWAVAGYCDTVTFVAADNIFSAHITGNLIIFAYQAVTGSDFSAGLRLLAIPVFITAVLAARRMVGKSKIRKYELLYWEGLLLLITGMASYILKLADMLSEQLVFVGSMFCVFAMGFQSVFEKLNALGILGPTEVLAGKLMRLPVQTGKFFKNIFSKYRISSKFIRHLIILVWFLAGCLAGAVAGKFLGLTAAILPGVVLVFCYFKMLERMQQKVAVSAENNEL